MTNLAILRETISAVEREKGVNIETDIRDFGQNKLNVTFVSTLSTGSN